jgi:serine/threonine protein kinase
MVSAKEQIEMSAVVGSTVYMAPELLDGSCVEIVEEEDDGAGGKRLTGGYSPAIDVYAFRFSSTES